MNETRLLAAEVALARILAAVVPLDGQGDGETIPLSQAQGRVLAADILSPLDFPHWDNSAMDGYAVRHGDVQGASPTQPVELQVVETIPAGQVPQETVGPGQAARIFTGAMVPPGADTIVIQEHTQAQGETVTILQAPDPQAFVRQRGEFRRVGERLLAQGSALGGADIALLAAAQQTQIPVYRRPRVALLSTGDELITPAQPLGPGQIVDSNQPALTALVTAAGATAIPLGIVADRAADLERAIAQALPQADILLSSGGVSVGDHDHVDRVLRALGATLLVESVAVKPGKPLTVAQFPQGPLYFGLPGNPVSALVSFWRFVEPALRKLGGWASPWQPPMLPAHTDDLLQGAKTRETYLWGHLRPTPSGLRFQRAGGSSSSGNLVTLGQCNALGIVPLGVAALPAGAPLQVMVLGRF